MPTAYKQSDSLFCGQIELAKKYEQSSDFVLEIVEAWQAGETAKAKRLHTKLRKWLKLKSLQL